MPDGGAQPEERRLACAIIHYTCVLYMCITVNSLFTVFQLVVLKKKRT